MTRVFSDDEIRELLLGRSVVTVEKYDEPTKCEGVWGDVEGKMTLDDGRELLVVPNEGCGGCSAGRYKLDSLERVDNIITRVDFEVEEHDKYGEERTYRIFVLAGHERINLLSVHGDDGNGYYGTGYELVVREAS